MTEQAQGSAGSMQVSVVIPAARERVYAAFLDPVAVAEWMAPENMQGHVHIFEARDGGQFRISLRYKNPEDAKRGKSAGDTDTYHGRFVELVRNQKIVEVTEFETAQPDMMGEMTMTVRLADAPDGTQVTLQYDNLPAGIRPEDNELGTRSSLRKLAALLA